MADAVRWSSFPIASLLSPEVAIDRSKPVVFRCPRRPRYYWRRTHFLAFRQIDAILAKLQWSLSEVSCALGLLFGRRLAIDYLFDRLCGEFFGARGAQWRWLFSFGSDSQPELDQAA